MKKRIVLLITIAVLVLSVCSVGVSAKTTTLSQKGIAQKETITEKNGVGYYGDFKMLSGYLVFYPLTVKDSADSLPLIVWANGTMCEPVLYMNLLSQIAKKGYIVVASSEVMSADGKAQSAAIDYIFEKSQDETLPFYNKVDPGKIGAAGHSQGGRSTVNAAVLDPRITACVSIAGSNYPAEAEQLTTPTLFLTGTADLVVLSSLWVKPAYTACKGPACYASLKGAVHTTCCISPDRIAHYTTAWFDAFLKQKSDAKAIFREGGALSKDTKWQDFVQKNMSDLLLGSVLSTGNILTIVICLVLFLLFFAYLLFQKKFGTPQEVKEKE